MPGSPVAHRRVTAVATATLAATMLAGLLPLPAAAAEPDAEPVPAEQPSVA